MRICPPKLGESPLRSHPSVLDASDYSRSRSVLRIAHTGSNPKKQGRPSHHPLFAVLAEARCIAHVWLRSGNTGAARGASAFLAEVRALLPDHVGVTLVRADSGFFDEAFLLTLEAAVLPYIVAARFTNPLQAAVYRLAFRAFAPGLEVAELPYQALRWTKARRLIVVREDLRQRPSARGRELFQAPGYRFHAVVTTVPAAPEAVWRTYNGRADTENRLKELKYSFGAAGFCSALLGHRGGPAGDLPALQSDRSLPRRPGRPGPPDAGHTAGDSVRVWRDPRPRRAPGGAPALSFLLLAATLPGSTSPPLNVGTQLQCSYR